MIDVLAVINMVCSPVNVSIQARGKAGRCFKPKKETVGEDYTGMSNPTVST